MKVYLVMHEGKPQWHRLCSWVDADKVGKNEIHVKSVRAFPLKKYAKEWIEQSGHRHYIIRSAIITK